MSESRDSDSPAHWVDDRSPTDPDHGTARVEAIPDPDSETVTFAWRGGDGETTTAWITAEADLVVTGSDMQ